MEQTSHSEEMRMNCIEPKVKYLNRENQLREKGEKKIDMKEQEAPEKCAVFGLDGFQENIFSLQRLVGLFLFFVFLLEEVEDKSEQSINFKKKSSFE